MAESTSSTPLELYCTPYVLVAPDDFWGSVSNSGLFKIIR